MEYNYFYISELFTHNDTIKLLGKDNAPLILSFLYQEFIKSNQRSIANNQLIIHLSDFLYDIRQRLGDEKYPKKAHEYIEDWQKDN